MLNLDWTGIFSKNELYAMRVNAVTRFMSCETPQAVEANIELAKYLNRTGLDSQNYPLVLELLRVGNFNVIEALLANTDPFTYFTKVQAGPYIIDFALRMLDKYAPGSVHEKILQIILGILYRTYHSPKEGYILHKLTLEHVNSIGKFLDKSKGQNDPTNRFILDILGDLGGFKSINNEDPEVDRLAAHSINIRNAFFDRTLDLKNVIPADLLVREDYRRTAVMPRDVVPFNA